MTEEQRYRYKIELERGAGVNTYEQNYKVLAGAIEKSFFSLSVALVISSAILAIGLS